MTSDPIAEARLALRDKKVQLLGEVARIEKALVALDELDDTGAAAFSADAPAPVSAAPVSVRTMMQNLLDEEDRDWSVAEILAEYIARGTPIHGTNPDSGLRAAVADAFKMKRIYRVAQGRYKSTIWTLSPEKGGIDLR